MNISSRFSHAIPEPSVRLFLRLCFLAAVAMSVFLLLKSSHHDHVRHHQLDIGADHSKV